MLLFDLDMERSFLLTAIIMREVSSDHSCLSRLSTCRLVQHENKIKQAQVSSV
jgi:hypothetical protein